jgi:very-short-patch-repair endonuclease
VLVNRTIEVDFHWPESGTIVEVDGPGHDRPPTRAEDARRDAALGAAGFEVRRMRARS